LKKNLILSDSITLEDNAVIPFFCDGKWSLYHLLSHVLLFTGPADVRISSFSLSENAIRSFINDKESGLLKSITLLFDISIPRRKMDLMLFAHDVFSEIRLLPNHSKVILIDGNVKACIISSQNLTPNPRLEAGVVFTTLKHYNYYSHVFDHYFSNAIAFDPYGKQ
jgi:hypothetical protein